MLMATLSGASLRAKSIHFSVKASSGVERSVLAIESLAFCAGEQIALCGPSGSGKTTLLNVLLGLKLLPGADISWDNIKLLSLSPSQQDRWRREHVGIVFQQFRHPVYPQIPGREFVAGLSCVDAMMRCGATQSSKLLGVSTD